MTLINLVHEFPSPPITLILVCFFSSLHLLCCLHINTCHMYTTVLHEMCWGGNISCKVWPDVGIVLCIECGYNIVQLTFKLKNFFLILNILYLFIWAEHLRVSSILRCLGLSVAAAGRLCMQLMLVTFENVIFLELCYFHPDPQTFHMDFFS